MAREHFIEAGGLRVRYLEEGTGPAVVLLHGAALGSSADVWSGNLAALASHGLRAIALDLPGFGESAHPGDPSVGFRTRFVPRFLDALDLDRAHLVGHSQSGRIAVTLALDEPQRVEKIVVVGTGSLLPPLPGAAKADGEGDEGGASEPTMEDSRRTLEDNVFHRERVTEEAVALRQRMSTGRNFEAFVARRASRGGEKRQKEAKPLWQRLGEVKAPMRLIYGRDDRGNAAERALLARQLHPSLDLHVIDHCRHLVQWDAPVEFAALAGDFLIHSRPR